MFKFSKEELLKNIKGLQKASVLVVGDLAIDEMIYGDTERISREAPVLILAYSTIFLRKKQWKRSAIIGIIIDFFCR